MLKLHLFRKDSKIGKVGADGLNGPICFVAPHGASVSSVKAKLSPVGEIVVVPVARAQWHSFCVSCKRNGASHPVFLEQNRALEHRTACAVPLGRQTTNCKMIIASGLKMIR
jgi:hypothetical protein